MPSSIRRALALLAALGMAACFPRGDDALTQMTPEQREYATEVLGTIDPGATEAELRETLGAPIRRTPGKLYFRRPGAGEGERVDVYFMNGRIGRIRYVSADPMWMWELNASGGRLVPRS